jgi:hypothetical protein
LHSQDVAEAIFTGRRAVLTHVLRTVAKHYQDTIA